MEGRRAISQPTALYGGSYAHQNPAHQNAQQNAYQNRAPSPGPSYSNNWGNAQGSIANINHYGGYGGAAPSGWASPAYHAHQRLI